MFSVGTGGVQRGCAMGGGREEGGGVSQLETDVLASSKHERLVTPPNTNTDTRRYAARQLQRHMPQSTVSPQIYMLGGERDFTVVH